MSGDYNDGERDEMENNLLAAGGLLMSIDQKLSPEVVSVDGEPTNMIMVSPPYLKSRYLLTVTRIPEETDQ